MHNGSDVPNDLAEILRFAQGDNRFLFDDKRILAGAGPRG
jgi:hypothetical protein